MTPHFETWADAYKALRDELLDAETVSPRGQVTKEILGAHFAIDNPRSRLGYHPQRGFNLTFALAEAVLLFQPSQSVLFPSFFNKNVINFSDDGEKLHGAYGARIVQYVTDMVNKLKDDPDSRQAVISIYSSRDLLAITKDVPCTMNLHCMIRRGKLDLHVSMRSNDLYWGTMYDLVAFSVFQEVVANELGIDVGTYYHTADSLHVYDHHFGWLDAIDHLQPYAFSFPQNVAGMAAAAVSYKLIVSELDGEFEHFYRPYQAFAEPFGSIFLRARNKKRHSMTAIEAPEWVMRFDRS